MFENRKNIYQINDDDDQFDDEIHPFSIYLWIDNINLLNLS